ncbi:MAG: D-aminoacylase [Nitrososphaeria archaeon]
MLDIIIFGGRIVDGSGNPWYKADIGIREGKIVEIGNLRNEKADKIIDARDHIVSPGFIDIHSHADITIPFNPYMDSAIMQGITTTVVGNCGISLAPLKDEKLDMIREYLSQFLPNNLKIEFKWNKFSEYLEWMKRSGVTCNVANLVGHGTVRISVMGMDARDPTETELIEMGKLVEEAMDSGAFGISTGLIYPPGTYSRTEELIEMAKIVSKYGGIYSSHIRGEGKTLIDAVKEAIRIGEEAHVPVQISHHKAAGRIYWGKTIETLSLMEDARERNVDVTCDVYPYTAGMTSLITLLPPWAHEGGLETLLERLRSSSVRNKIREDMMKGLGEWESFVKDYGWENIVISSVKTDKNKCFEGKNLKEICELMKASDEYTALFNLILEEEGCATMIVYQMCEEDVRRVISSHLSMVSTDSWPVSQKGLLAFGKPHPRFYGTYPRIFRRYVREEKILTLEDAVRKMTSFPAQKLGLKDRGLIKENYWADIVVFDIKRINDKATFDNPHQYPEGISYVIVNGRVVAENGIHTHILAGKVLSKK